MILDFIPPKPTHTITQAYGFLQYALEASRIYMRKIKQTEAGGQNKLIKELQALAQVSRLPIQTVVNTPARINFYVNRGFVAVSRSNELGYTVMVWVPK